MPLAQMQILPVSPESLLVPADDWQNTIMYAPCWGDRVTSILKKKKKLHADTFLIRAYGLMRER